MRTFIVKCLLSYLIAFSILSMLKHLQDMPRKRLVSKGVETNLIKWKGFMERRDANTLFFGSSRIFNSIHPIIFDSIAGTRSYNMGTSSQSIAETYSFMKEAFDRNKNVKRVVVDLLERSFRVTDYMRLTQNAKYLGMRNRWELYYHSGLPRNIMNIAFPLLEDVGYINLRAAFRMEPDTSVMNGKGVWIEGFNLSKADDTADMATLSKTNSTIESRQELRIKQDRIEFIDRIVKLCQERGVRLTFTCIPYSYVTNEYEIGFFRSVAARYPNVGFFTDYPPLTNLDIRSDGFHLNNRGADKCTRALARHLGHEIQE